MIELIKQRVDFIEARKSSRTPMVKQDKAYLISVIRTLIEANALLHGALETYSIENNVFSAIANQQSVSTVAKIALSKNDKLIKSLK